MRVGPSTPTIPAAWPSTCVRREHERALAQLVDLVLGADAHREPGFEQLVHERHDHDLVLEHLEQARRALRGGERLLLGRELADAAEVQRLAVLGRAELEERRTRVGDDRVDARDRSW